MKSSLEERVSAIEARNGWVAAVKDRWTDTRQKSSHV
jgi:hypothetical protein